MKSEVIDILFESFYTNPASIEVVKQDKRKDKRFRLLLEYSYYISRTFGKVYLSEDGNSCVLIVDSDKKRVTAKLVWWYFRLAISVIGLFRAKKILKRLKILNASRPNTSHVYVWYIGVRVIEQNKGLGSKLMERVLKENSDRVICLETTKEENFSFYEKLGFKRAGRIAGLDYPFTLYRMNED